MMGKRGGKSGSRTPSTSSDDTERISRKQRAKQKEKAEKEAHQQHLDDLAWVDNDKNRRKKLAREQDREAKRVAQAQRKAENKLIAAADEAKTLKDVRKKDQGKNKEGNVKMTRIQIERVKLQREREAKERAKELERERQRLAHQEFLDFNPNRIHDDDELVATSVEAAIEITTQRSGEITPSLSRQSSAFDEFREAHHAKFKKAHPKLKVKQIDAAIKKAFEDSHHNPLNHT